MWGGLKKHAEVAGILVEDERIGHTKHYFLVHQCRSKNKSKFWQQIGRRVRCTLMESPKVLIHDVDSSQFIPQLKHAHSPSQQPPHSSPVAQQYFLSAPVLIRRHIHSQIEHLPGSYQSVYSLAQILTSWGRFTLWLSLLFSTKPQVDSLVMLLVYVPGVPVVSAAVLRPKPEVALELKRGQDILGDLKC